MALCASALAIPPVPRKAADFTIVEPSGKKILLSSLKGKVVVLEFIATTCPHCARMSQMLTRLDQELGPRGFQPIGIAFNPEADPATVPEFVREFGVSFPVGYSSASKVLPYLGVSPEERYVYPEIMVIDRKGVVRAQSPATGDPNLQDENYLKNLVNNLLKETS